MFVKKGIVVQKENESLRIQQVAKIVIRQLVNVGDQRVCPECNTLGRVVWVSQDKKTMGVQCSRSHREAERSASKFGGTVVPSTKTRKNTVFITAAA
ncbi:MAG: hypothetical protein ABSG33_11610 [Candidatus Bathyarchaeia archaeon]